VPIDNECSFCLLLVIVCAWRGRLEVVDCGVVVIWVDATVVMWGMRLFKEVINECNHNSILWEK
jgi:hypothetical protein